VLKSDIDLFRGEYMFELILPAYLIPNETKVTKPTGSKKYILQKDGIKVYGENKKEVLFTDCFILSCPEQGTLNIITEDAKLKICFERSADLMAFVGTIVEE
jgi:hypothetical protein